MAGCREILRRIEEADGAYDQETLRHCLKCEGCRRELYGQVAAGGSEIPAIPESLELRLRAMCRNGRRRRERYRLGNAAMWTGAAAALLLCIWGLFPAKPAHESEVPVISAAADSEWDGSLLLNRLSDIGTELSAAKQLIQADLGEQEVFM